MLIASFLFLSYKVFENVMDKIEINKEYNITVGKIVKYHIFGVGSNRHVTYEYHVNGISYTRLINGPKRHFDECDENIELCADKYFLVVYSIYYPNKSLIDFTKEVQNINNIRRPKSLVGFQ